LFGDGEYSQVVTIEGLVPWLLQQTSASLRHLSLATQPVDTAKARSRSQAAE